MCAFNAVDGVFACENRRLLTTLLREEWGFDGMVSSDYGATRSAVASIRAGLDQTFTIADWGRHYRDLPALVRSGAVPRSLVTQAARRVLRLMVRVGRLDPARPAPPVDVRAHADLSRTAAQEGTVLLRNDAGLLPLRTAGLREVAVIGPYATTAHPGGSGSSRVTPYRTVSPVQGLQARLGPGVRVVGDDGRDRSRAAALARSADVAVVVTGDMSGETSDRTSMRLPAGQDELVEAVAAANPRTVVVLQTGGPVAMPWLPRTPTLLETWYPGQEGGAALARVLLGDVDPSGRLPMTFPVSLSQSPTMGRPRYPAGPDGYDYDERLEVGYRGFDARGRTPLFPFGHGLSYARSTLSDLQVTVRPGGGARVSFTVKNTSTRGGVVVPQVYLGFPAGAGEPPRVLAGFAREQLRAGESRRLTIALPQRRLQVWDTAASAWRVPAGVFTAHVGRSSRDLPLEARFDPAP